MNCAFSHSFHISGHAKSLKYNMQAISLRIRLPIIGKTVLTGLAA